MLSLAAERSLSLSSSTLCRASTFVPGLRYRSLHSTSERPTAFAYISRRRNQQVITIAMSSLSRRHASSSSPGPGSSSKPPSKLDSHAHSHADHDHGHSHDGHDHSHSGIFHSHAHDHSEGAEQIMTALSKGTLDRGTRITLLGQYPSHQLGMTLMARTG
jgi:ABC-type nickel/cobalt efflux system permease component RcnA